MYTACLFCHSDLGRNEALEHFSVGRKLAFDASRGRLWVVCPSCGRWNLTPLLERWEAIEECERLFRETRLRASTDQIGLARLREGTELVRIGRPLRPEFAAWRYGDVLRRRRRRAFLWTGVGVAATGAVLAGGFLGGFLAGASLPSLIQGRAWVEQIYRQARAVARVPGEDGEPVTVRGRHLQGARLLPDGEGRGWRLRVAHSRGETELAGEEAVSTIGRLLVAANQFGASPRQLRTAVDQLEEVPVPDRYFRTALERASRRGYRYSPIPAFPKEIRLALEMAAHEEQERRALEGELAALERAWREAEELAAIADDLAVPPSVERLLRRIRRATPEP